MHDFDYFVMFAEMRTGSNLLEANLNEFDGLSCVGEAFNPAFIGHQGNEEMFGVTAAQREENPFLLLDAIRAQDGMTGFRFFNDHDPRILPTLLDDPRCAKIILIRNPLDSYVSLKIAQQTNQWKLGDVKTRRVAKVSFDPVEFEQHVAQLQKFQQHILHALQSSGQSAFYLAYEDANDVAVLNGLAKWLGVDARIERPSTKLKRQNPEPLEEKLTNIETVREGMARLDRFNLSRSPAFEPRRGGVIWAYRACRKLPLVFAPLPGGDNSDVLAWMKAVDENAPEGLLQDFTAESWQGWLRENAPHLCFSVTTHPLVRAHEVYRRQVLHGQRENVRRFMARVHGVTLPPKSELDSYSIEDHRIGFAAFLRFVQANLNGQTSMMTLPAWAPQSELIADITTQCPIHALLKQEDLAHALPGLGARLGADLPGFVRTEAQNRLTLDSIYDAEIERLGRAAYEADYLRLGYRDWRE